MEGGKELGGWETREGGEGNGVGKHLSPLKYYAGLTARSHSQHVYSTSRNLTFFVVSLNHTMKVKHTKMS